MTWTDHRVVSEHARAFWVSHAHNPRLLLLALLLALPARAQDGGHHVVDVEHASVLTTAGAFLELDGGVWLSDAKALELARERVSCREESAELRRTAGDVEARAIVTAVVVAVVAGAAAGYALGLSLPPR